MLIKEAMRKGMISLKTNNIQEPNLKSRLLMQYILNKPRQYMLIHDNEELTNKQEKAYLENIEKMIKGVPLQHITHSQEFMKMNFYVNENVLIPRPDTEILVEAVNNNVEDKITFVKSDLFENIVKEKYDIIVSNPPYIKKDFMKKLDKEVQQEPYIALDGGYDGLDFYRKIISEGYQYLKFKGYLCMEIGYDQKQEVFDIIKSQEKYSNTYSKIDLGGNDRIVVTTVQ